MGRHNLFETSRSLNYIGTEISTLDEKISTKYVCICMYVEIQNIPRLDLKKKDVGPRRQGEVRKGYFSSEEVVNSRWRLFFFWLL